MKSVLIKGKRRESLGKKDAKKLRAQELVPSVLYGGDEPVHFAVSFSELRKLVYTPNVYLIDLEIDGKVIKAIMQDIQWHPVQELAMHVDFLAIQDDKPIKIEVPVKVLGLAKGIKSGGKLSMNLRKLKVKALAAHIPDSIDIDVTDVALGQSIKVGDVNIENVEFQNSKSNVIVSVIITRAAKSAGGIDGIDDEDSEEEGGEETTVDGSAEE